MESGTELKDRGQDIPNDGLNKDQLVASQVQEDNETLPPGPKEESSIGNGNASTLANIEQMPPMENADLPQQNGQYSVNSGIQSPAGVKAEGFEVDSEAGMDGTELDALPSTDHIESAEPSIDVKAEPSSELPEKSTANAEIETCLLPESKTNGDPGNSEKNDDGPEQGAEPIAVHAASSDVKAEKDDGVDLANRIKTDLPTPDVNGTIGLQHSFNDASDGSESGTEDEQSAFMQELESFFKDKSMEFKAPKFYGEGLNCLKLWRSVIRLGGYDKVTSCKLWRQVGESFRPPKTCTTVSWTFRGFYEKALLDYERHKARTGELSIPIAAPAAPVAASQTEPVSVDNQTPGSGRARRDAAARAMQGWHSQRLIGNGEVSDPIIKDKNSMSQQKREKQLKSLGFLKRKKPEYLENTVSAARTKLSKPQLDITVIDVGPPADWVKINVQKTKDCFEVYALVPGLLREEVRVQSDPAGRLVISGEPEHPDNPWGVTGFKKVVSLPGRIDPHQTSAVVTLHGQLFVRVPFAETE